jgi:hypothetical protein
MHVPSNLLSSFVTLFVTIGPIETAVIFAGLTSGTHHNQRRSLALRSVAIAGLMLLLFAVGGNVVLSTLHISLPAFRVAGGMLLFLQALTLTFSSPGLSSINEVERRDAEKPGNIAVFPLALPLIASPRGALGRRAVDRPSRRLERRRIHHRDDGTVSDHRLHRDARGGRPRPDLGTNRSRPCRKDIRHIPSRACRAIHFRRTPGRIFAGVWSRLTPVFNSRRRCHE